MRRVGRIQVGYYFLEMLLRFMDVKIIDHYPAEPWRKMVEFLVEGAPFDEIVEGEEVPVYQVTYHTREERIEFERRGDEPETEA